MTTKVKSGDQLETAFLTTGTPPDYVITKVGETALQDNEYFLVNFHAAAAAAVTINVNGQGAKALKDETGAAVTTIAIDTDYWIKWDVSKDAYVVVGAIGGGSGSAGGAGQRSKTAKTVGTTYQAGPQGGFIVYTGLLADLSQGIIVYSDANPTPTTIVARSSIVSNAYGIYDTTTVAILPNMYYKIVNSGLTDIIYNFYEIGNNPGSIAFVSSAQDLANATHTITHNLNITQADVEKGRYAVFMSSRVFQGGGIYAGVYGMGGYNSGHAAFMKSFWSASDPSVASDVSWQANTLKIITYDGSGTLYDARVIIVDTRAYGVGSTGAKFNNVITGHVLGTVYDSGNGGVLVVNYKWNTSGTGWGISIYSDDQANPTTLVAKHMPQAVNNTNIYSISTPILPGKKYKVISDTSNATIESSFYYQ